MQNLQEMATFQPMTPAYNKGLLIGRFCRKEDPEAVPVNPYDRGTIDAMEWDRGWNHGRFDQTQQDDERK